MSLLVVGPSEKAQIDEGGVLFLEHTDDVIERQVDDVVPVDGHKDVPSLDAT